MKNHGYYKNLMMGYLDGELSEKEKKEFLKHLRYCKECKKELENFQKMEAYMGKIKLKSLPDDVKRIYWLSLYNRLERKIGWILLSIGIIILGIWGGVSFFKDIILSKETPIYGKIGIVAVIGGLVVLIVSVLKERIFVAKYDKYSKEVEK